jgi:hypothetical protein
MNFIKNNFRDLTGVVGLMLLTVGSSLIYGPLALVVPGSVMLLVASFGFKETV